MAVGALAYANCFEGQFLFDDWPTLLQNEALAKFWPPHWAVCSDNGGLTTDGRPVVAFTLMLNRVLGGLDPVGFHAVNLAIHLAAALLLFALVRRTLRRCAAAGPATGLRERAELVAWAAASLWVVHPLTTAAVTYIVQRAEALAALFYLLTLAAYARGIDEPERRRWPILATLACLLGMATKETVATVPLLALLYDRTFAAGSFRGALRLRWRRLVALTAGWIVLALLVASTGNRGGSAGARSAAAVWDYLVTQAGGLPLYLGRTFWPVGLIFDYGKGTSSLTEVWPQAVAVLGLLGATGWALWRHPCAGFIAAAWFLLLAPSSSVVPVITQTLAEHRLYLPTAVLVAGVVGAGAAVPLRRRWLFPVVVAAGVAALAVLTVRRNAVYHDIEQLWRENIALRPRNARAYFSLAEELIRRRRADEALPPFVQALELEPDSVAGRHAYAMALLGLGRREDAVREFEQTLRHEPNHLLSLVNLGQTLLELRRAPDAVPWLRRAAELDRKSAEPRLNLAAALAAAGDADGALEAIETAVREFPEHSGARYNLGIHYARRQRAADAEREYRAAVRLSPRFVTAWQNLGNLLMRTGRPRDAAEAFAAAVQVAPDEPALNLSLAYALATAGRTGEALAALRAYLQRQPGDADARQLLLELGGER